MIRYEKETHVGDCTSRVMLEISSTSDAEERQAALLLIPETTNATPVDEKVPAREVSA